MTIQVKDQERTGGTGKLKGEQGRDKMTRAG